MNSNDGHTDKPTVTTPDISIKRALTYNRGADGVTACVWGLANAAPPEALYQDRTTVIQPHIGQREVKGNDVSQKGHARGKSLRV